ncbi:MAG TPA: LamG-like jellyroll fold domain-containing protein [Thermoleophilaceae bacterium]
MSVKILDYTLDSLTPENPDGSYPATVTGCTVVTGPGATTLGTYPQALDFSDEGELHVTLPPENLNAQRFCVRLVFKVDNAVTARETLTESNALPFSVYLEPPTSAGDFQLTCAVTTAVYGTGKASSEFLVDLHVGTWYAADLVYDTDTVALFVDEVIYSVHAFPDGTIAAGSADQLVAGLSTGGADRFTGVMAALQLHDDIPIELEAALDERRSHPQWFLTYKQEEIKSSLALGEPSGEFYLDLPSTSWIQEFPGGIIMYQDANGQAFEMHGAILQEYWALPSRAPIGYLISDEIDGAQAGARKSVFSGGGIYWSSSTGAVPVIGQIWVDYEGMGEADAIGLPVASAVAIGGGMQQVFQRGQMYFKSGASKAFEVHGAILAQFLSSGGTASWGFPVSNEQDVVSGSTAIGRISEFERCSIYWSASSGAFEVHGEIRDRYRSVGGAGGALGFPTSDEADVPGASAPARFNTFQHGSIVWFGSAGETYVCLPFDITLGRVDTVESEGWLRGENDVYMYATIDDNGHVIHSERIPHSGDSDGNNIYDVEKTFDLGPAGIVPNDPSRIIKFSLDVWDSDWPDDDDHLGQYDFTLEMANAWGLRGNPSGLFNSGAFDNINSITWAVSPRIDEALLTEKQKWWGVRNQGTDELTWDQYASAFSDVDSQTEWWDITDWLAKLFYSAVVEGLAKHGNCFGMCLEAIYSKKDRALLKLPIDRFVNWNDVRNEFNIKHQYQVGAPAIWWFVGEFLSGKTHDPVSVFRATRDAYYSGCDPVLCISQHYDFSGAPHCILPIGWNDSVTPWQMLVHDPNFPSLSTNDPGPRILTVDPGSNTYSYDGGSNHYSGGEWSGGRLHYMPFDLLCERPRTPIFDAIMLLITGVIVILGGDSETTSLTDENGVDLDAFGPDSVARLQAGQSLAHKFVSVKGFDTHMRECAKERTTPRPKEPPDDRRPRPHGVLTSELHMRSLPKTFSRKAPPNKRSGDEWKRITLKEYLCQLAPAAIREKFARHPDFVSANQGRLMLHLTESAVMKEILGVAVTGAATPIGPLSPISDNYVHTTRGLGGGLLQYGLKQGLTQLMLSAKAATGEAHVLQVKDLGTSTSRLTLRCYRDKEINLQVHNKLGAGRDHLRISIDGIPLAGGAELQINFKPGIGGVELVTAGEVLKATVSIDYLRRGLRLSSTFDVSEQDGMRVLPSTFITANQLKVSRIDTLFGDSLGTTLVQPI